MDNKQRVIEEKRQKLVDTLIDYIEKNPKAWQAGWYSMPNLLPINGKTQKKYNGINALYLSVLSSIKGYRDSRWVTFNQAKDLGAHVRSGEKSSEVFYWSFYDKKTKQPYDAKTCEGMTIEERKRYWDENVRPIIKYYQVFNAQQCDNMPEYELPRTPEMEAEERRRQNEIIEKIISNSAAPVNYDGGDRAYYSPKHDSIHLPAINDFKTMPDYYATALHEIAHSTGHQSRLNRNLSGLFGTPDYAKEELRAELASVFMQVEFGVSVEGEHIENHGAYLASWLQSVKDNQKEFFAAASDAEKITSYVSDNYLNAKSEAELKFETNTSFAKQVDAVLSGADTTSTHLKVMGTPLILRQLGAQNLPVLMTAKHLKNIVAASGNDVSVNYHGIESDTVKNLPELLADPVLVMDSLTRDDSVVVVTSAVDRENRPIIGAIKFDGFGRQDGQIIEANILLSVYGRNNFNDFIQRNFDANSILYWNKEKSQELSVNPGVQFPDVMANLDSNIIIRKAKAFVNSFEEKTEFFKKNTAADKAKVATDKDKKPIVINFYAGPGAGKTTAALELTAALKKAGINVEYVSEYAKELVLEGMTEILNDQRHVTDEQFHRLDRLRNSVDVIVTDSPVLLGIVYGGDRIDDAYRNQLRGYYNSLNNIDLHIERRTEYQTEGRVESEQQAKALDIAISSMLKQQNIKCREYTTKEIENIVELVKQFGQSEQANTAEQVGQADKVKENENTKEKYVIDLQLGYENEMLLSNDLKKLGYENDHSIFARNEARDIAAFDANTNHWLNEIKYIGKDGKTISGVYGRVFNGIMIESADILRFNTEGLSRDEAEQFADVLRGFGVEVRLKTFEQAQQDEQVGQADTAEEVQQVEQVSQNKWHSIPLDTALIGEEHGKSTKLRLPEGEYSSFVFFAPTKFIKRDEKSASVKLSVNDEFKYNLMKGNQRVELNGSELRRAIAGQVVGVRAQRFLSEENAATLSELYRNVPEEMRQYPNWCVYTTRWNGEKGKKDKDIFSPVLGLKDGFMQWASIDKPETWTTFDAALKFAEENNCAGLVFALDGKTGISCIDLDKAIVKDGKLNGKLTNRAEGELSALAARLSDEMKDTYIETSASGNGLHIFVKDDLLLNGKYKNRAETPDGEIEVYEDRRFMAMTGKLRSNTQRLGKSPVATTSLIRGLLGKRVGISQERPLLRQQADKSDSAVIERIRKSKRGAEFEALFCGENLTGNASCTDMKLLNMLAFFTDCDTHQMERIFKSSALYREKKDKYLLHSINKACETLEIRMSDRAFFGGGNKKGGGRGNAK